MDNKESNISYNKKVFFIISLLQIAITTLLLVIVLTSDFSREWRGVTTEISIYHFLLYSKIKIVFIVIFLFTLFNPVYSAGSAIVAISLLISYIFSAGFYGPRLPVALSIIEAINKPIWLFISALLIGLLLVLIGKSYMKNIRHTIVNREAN